VKIHVTKAFRPYKIEINTSQDHQDLLRLLTDAQAKYHVNTVGMLELMKLRDELIKTQTEVV
jgi:hypothetical protein